MLLDTALPSSVRRPMLWCLGAALLIVLGFISVIVLVRFGVIGPLHPWLAIAPVASVLVMKSTGVRIARHASGRAIAARCLLCPRCDYDLRDHEAVGICPECGATYMREVVRRRWVETERRLWPRGRGRV